MRGRSAGLRLGALVIFGTRRIGDRRSDFKQVRLADRHLVARF